MVLSDLPQTTLRSSADPLLGTVEAEWCCGPRNLGTPEPLSWVSTAGSNDPEHLVSLTAGGSDDSYSVWAGKRKR